MFRLTRVFKIFVKALRLTLKGEAIPTPDQRYPTLYQWVKQGQALVQGAFSVADKLGMDEDARLAVTFTLEHRNISMQTILSAVRHHLTLEYPMLMQAQIEHNLTTLYALNLDDQFRVAQLLAHLQAQNTSPEITEQVMKLSQHLKSIPSNTTM